MGRGGVWWGIVLVLALALVGYMLGFAQRSGLEYWLSLFFILILTAIYPPAGIGLAGVILFALIFARFQQLQSAFARITSPSKGAASKP